jgi:hypothetical protein
MTTLLILKNPFLDLKTNYFRNEVTKRGLSTGPSMILNLFPWPTSLGQRSQITEGPCTGPSHVLY